MSADILKRKIRNFPAANLTERIATGSWARLPRPGGCRASR